MVKAGDEPLALPQFRINASVEQFAGSVGGRRIAVRLDPLGRIDAASAIKIVKPVRRHERYPPIAYP